MENIRLKLFLITVIILAVFFSTFFYVSGKGPALSCFFRQFKIMDMGDWYSCPAEVGSETKSIQMCKIYFTNNEDDICRAAYAIKHNKIEICSQLTDDLTDPKYDCFVGIGKLNKDTGVCDNFSGFTQEMCLGAILQKPILGS